MALAVLGSVLRLYQLTGARLWYDEIGSVWMASLPFSRLLAATAGDVHPPGYLAVLWAAVHLAGSSVLVVRLPSVLFSLAAFPLSLAIGRRFGLSDTALLIGTALLAVSPWQLYFAQEARMYAMLQAAFLAAVWCVLARRWGLLALAVAVMLYTHNYGVLYAATLGGLALWREWERPAIWRVGPILAERIFPRAWPGIIAGFGGGGFMFLPWAVVVVRQMGEQKDAWWQQPTHIGGALAPLYEFLFHDTGLGGLTLLGQVLAFGLAAFCVVRLVERRGAGPVTLAYLTLAPAALALVAEVLYRPIFLARALTGAAVPFYLLCGWALATLSARGRVWAGAVLAPMLALAVLFYFPREAVMKGFTWPAAEQVAARFEPGDVIYHVNSGTLFQWHADYPRPADPQYMAPPFAGDLGALTSQTVSALGVEQVELEALAWRRAWVVWSAGPTAGLAEDEWVSAVLARYPRHEWVADLSVNWLPGLTAGGLWLLYR